MVSFLSNHPSLDVKDIRPYLDAEGLLCLISQDRQRLQSTVGLPAERSAIMGGPESRVDFINASSVFAPSNFDHEALSRRAGLRAYHLGRIADFEFMRGHDPQTANVCGFYIEAHRRAADYHSNPDAYMPGAMSEFLSGAHVPHAIAARLKFIGLNMDGASLPHSDWSGTYALDLSAQGCNLNGSNWRKANANGADLRDAIVKDMSVEGATFCGAKLPFFGFLTLPGRAQCTTALTSYWLESLKSLEAYETRDGIIKSIFGGEYAELFSEPKEIVGLYLDEDRMPQPMMGFSAPRMMDGKLKVESIEDTRIHFATLCAFVRERAKELGLPSGDFNDVFGIQPSAVKSRMPIIVNNTYHSLAWGNPDPA